MKICITGITGRIGGTLAEALLAQGHEVRGLVMADDPLLETAQQMGVQISIGSLHNKATIAQAVQDADAIVHLAAIISYLPQDDARLYQTNVLGTHNVLDAVTQVAARPAHIIFASTDATYPSNAPLYQPVDENHPQQPTSYYGLTKVLGEQMVRFLSTKPGLSFTITRFSFTQAAHELIDPQGAFAHRVFFANGRLRYLKAQGSDSPQAQETVALLEKVAAADEPLLLPLDAAGNAQISEVTDARDIAQGLHLALERREARNQVFNLGPPTAHSFAEVIPYMAKATGRRYVEVALPTPAISVQTSNAKARLLLGYKPRYTIFDMIDEAVGAVK